MNFSGILLRSSLIAAFAGFLFGFDTVVISGAEQQIQSLWELNDTRHGLVISMALWGTVLGAFIGGWPADRYGRKSTLLWIGILYFVSAVWSGLATGPYTFMIARFIGGVGVGISTVVAPMYIAEISPPGLRGRLAGMFQFNIVFGILIAFLSNALLKDVGEHDWRWMLGVEAFPALLYTLLCFGIPESPRWLIAKRNLRERAIGVLKKMNADATDAEINVLADQIAAASAKEDTVAHRFFTPRLRIPIMLAFLIAFFNQLSGINAILYFAPRIFGLTGLDEQAALLQSVGIGVINLVFTFVGLYLIDRLGRRTLLYIGSFGYIASLGIAAATFLYYAPQFQVASDAIALQSASKPLIEAPRQSHSEQKLAELKEDFEAARTALNESSSDPNYGGNQVTLPPDVSPEAARAAANAALEQASERSGYGGTIVLLSIFAFIAAHAVGQGAVIWVFISEIFPNQHRAAGQSLGSFTHWIFAALLTQFFPAMVAVFAPGYVFLFFCAMMILQLLWVATMVPETKGIPLEEIQKKLGIV